MTPCSEVYVYTVVTVVAACLTTSAGAPADTSRCPNLSDGAPQYYDDGDGRCYPCPRCDPGEGLSEVCGDGLGKNARCQPCPDESFQSVSAASVCITCRRCDNTMEDEIPCTPETDRKCGKCELRYFRYNPRDDHCVRCQDERNSQFYPDCLRTTPLPQALDATQNAETSTTYIPTPNEGPLMSPVGIALIVILALVVCTIIIIVLFWKCRHRTCSCRVSSLCDGRKKRPRHWRHTILKVTSMSEPAYPESQPNIQQMAPEQMQRGTPITVHSSQHQHSEVHVDLEVGQEDPENQPETEPLIIPGHDLTETPSGSNVESMQGAIPTDSSHYLLSKAQQPTEDSDPQSADDAVDNPNDQNEEEGSEENAQHRDAEEASAPQDSGTSNTMHDSDQREMGDEVNRRYSEESSSSKATQTSLDSNSPSASPDEVLESEDEEDKHKRFLERFDQAIKCTKGVPISKMNREDITLLHENMYEQPENLCTSKIFHYARFAELFHIHKNQIRMFRNAEDVLHHLEATKVVEMTVDKILEKLKDCGKCYHIVRELVDQILKREQPNAG
ncbi:tumor necrosis factor receptor superfamily member 19-like isoform X2 [Patiria miniata]|uniref:TNFR-Cys domain-containing protein n=1 Tax=Patiria miniata TaxID=46514 RepID=A0A913ZV71_PATMI|nr:tumor necrosis factor receptor superfamily member 19-like isoform X2 [Patiria miniata]